MPVSIYVLIPGEVSEILNAPIKLPEASKACTAILLLPSRSVRTTYLFEADVIGASYKSSTKSVCTISLSADK